MLMRLMKSKKGFTLVELMVVIIILGILVAIAIPIYNNVTKSAKENACKANIRTIQSAVQMYQADHDGKLPSSLRDLVSESESGTKYIDELPKCPVSDYTADYDYERTTGIVSCDHK